MGEYGATDSDRLQMPFVAGQLLITLIENLRFADDFGTVGDSAIKREEV